MTKAKVQDKEWGFEIHKRLIARDPIAPAELAEAFLEPLVEKLTMLFPLVKDDHKIQDAVTDTLVNYIQKPIQFDPSKNSLNGFLIMSAKRDLQNILSKQCRLNAKEKVSECVEVLSDSGNKQVERTFTNSPLDNLVGKEIQQKVSVLFDEPKDREFLDLMLHGERVTERYAAVLGIENLPIPEQRKIVKQHKDRIGKKLERLGEKISESRKEE